MCATDQYDIVNYMHVYKLTMASIEGSTMVDYSIQLVWPDVVFTDKILRKVKTVMNNKD